MTLTHAGARLVFAAALALPGALAFAQAPAWRVPIAGPSGAAASLGNGKFISRAVATDASGGVIVAGATPKGTVQNMLTTKLTSAGVVAWQKVFAGAAGKGDSALGVAADSAGNAIVTGISVNASGTGDIKTIKYAAANGNVLWEKVFDGGRDDAAYAVAVDAAQDVLIAGESINAAGNADIRVLKYSGADGTLLWQRAYDGGRDDYVSDIAVDASGNVAVTGFSVNAADGGDMVTLKLRASDGAILWQRVFDSGAEDQAYGVATDSSGNVFIVGFSDTPPEASAVVLKYDASTGKTLWRQAISSGYGDFGQAIAVDAAGNAVVAIQSRNSAGNFDFRTVKLVASTGVVAWDRRDDSGRDDYAYQLAIDSAGNVVTVGSTVTAAGDTDWKVVRHAASDGAVLADSTLGGSAGASDDAFGIATGPGGVFVAGTSLDGGAQSIVVARYAWVAGPALAAPSLVSPNGDVTTTASPTYRWNAVAGATSYTLLVQNSGGIGVNRTLTADQAGCASGSGSCSFTPQAGLVNGTSWTWKVNASNASGTSAWSAAYALNIAVPTVAPPVPTLASPTGNITTTTPTYTWNASPGASSYYLFVQNLYGVAISITVSASQAGCLSGTGTCSFQPATALGNNASWSWFVYATNAYGSSGWSAAGRITVNAG